MKPTSSGQVAIGAKGRSTLPIRKNAAKTFSGNRHNRGLTPFLPFLLCLSLLLPSLHIGATTPGTPGVPQAATQIYLEDFENNSPPNCTSVNSSSPYNGVPLGCGNPVVLTSYTGSAAAQNKTYTADLAFRLNCNGQVLGGAYFDPSNPYLRSSKDSYQASNCDGNPTGGTNYPSYGNTLQESYALGLLHGLAPGSAAIANHSLTELTDAANQPVYPNAGSTMFATTTPITLPYTNRFLTLQVEAAAINCNASHPILDFSLVNGATQIPLFNGTGIDTCSSVNGNGNSLVQDLPGYSGGPTSNPGQTIPPATVTGVGNIPATKVHVGLYTANIPQLYTGSTVGLLLQNGQFNGTGNDGSIDDVRLLDVSPQLDKSFSPTSTPINTTSTLTLTITNTTDLLAKNGWSFTDTLPTGLTIATTPAISTTCSGGSPSVANAATVTASAGGTSIAVTGNLDLNMTSCIVKVNVTSSTANTYNNTGCTNTDGTPITPCTSNFTLSGLNPPGSATVTFYGANISIAKTDNSATYQPCATTNYLVTVTNTGVASGATGLTFNDTLPNGVTLTGSTSVAFTGGATCPTATAGTAPGTGVNILAGYTCTMPALASAGATATIVFTIPVKYACTASSY